jgi:hypothetical protein
VERRGDGVLVTKPEGKSPVGRPRLNLKFNNKISFEGIA